jgi:hypothetical protein
VQQQQQQHNNFLKVLNEMNFQIIMRHAVCVLNHEDICDHEDMLDSANPAAEGGACMQTFHDAMPPNDALGRGTLPAANVVVCFCNPTANVAYNLQLQPQDHDMHVIGLS